ncbi:hypothetical protein Hanom_Chr06g00566591 [Helianthus anomalus]
MKIDASRCSGKKFIIGLLFALACDFFFLPCFVGCCLDLSCVMDTLLAFFDLLSLLHAMILIECLWVFNLL